MNIMMYIVDSAMYSNTGIYDDTVIQSNTAYDSNNV